MRDAMGGVLVLASVLNCNIASPLAAEALVCAQALRLRSELGLQSAVVEGDALAVIKKSQSSEVDKSEMRGYIRDIQYHRLSFNSLSFKHTSRSTNLVAHTIAKESLKTGDQFYLIGRVPAYAGGVAGIGSELGQRARLRI
ncbi:hypothetical protein J1N35_010728 [Gossypium stocksii]|uniref:RNase H type-1 domain-containing protein n=1 Tax=Gossypium stocksii TaxID=47602 RepID=A0A9D3W328_9ROSI|nr:hypothetical protein J1N35_010728 [Gossypium stocksii]